MWGFVRPRLQAARLAENSAPMSSSSAFSALLRLPSLPEHLGNHPEHIAFHDLVQRIEAQRALLAEWQEAVDAYRQRYARDAMPLWQELLQVQVQLVQALDAMTAHKLGHADRAMLHALLVQLAGEVARNTRDAAQRAAMQEVVQRYGSAPEDDGAVPRPASAASTDGVEPPATAQAQADSADDVDWNDPDAVAAYCEAQERLAQQTHSKERAAHQQQRQRKREQQEAERKAQAAKGAEKPASQSLRDVYRRLASSLHPDREPDETERARKNGLMQEVNRAYEAGNLLALLELQLAAEQLDASKLASYSPTRLQHYNQVLERQLQDLQQEVRDVPLAFCAEFGHGSAHGLKPGKIMALLRAQLQALKQHVLHQRMLLNGLQSEPDMLKDWLKQERIWAKQDR